MEQIGFQLFLQWYLHVNYYYHCSFYMGFMYHNIETITINMNHQEKYLIY